MKEPRFLREYISYKAKQIKSNPFWSDERKQKPSRLIRES